MKLIKHIFAILLNRPVEVTSPQGGRFHLWLREHLVLPVIAGGADEETDEEKAAKAKEAEEEAEAKKAEEDEEAEAKEAEEKEAEEAEAKKGEKTEIDWKRESRKHENRAKAAERKLEREAKERTKLEAAAKERADAEKTEHEKAVDQAREEGKQEALTAAQKEQRETRLEVSVSRLAAKGVEVGDGDEKKTIRFADPEDAQVFLERNLSKGSVDADDIFTEDGKVNDEAVTEALVAILEEKPVLGAEHKARPKGGAVDAGKGKGTGKALEEMSPEEHFQRIQKK